VIFEPLELAGAFVLEAEKKSDERGFFARTFCAKELAAHGLDSRAVQMNVSFNHRRGTVRGMHFQRAPMAEPKVVRCTRGALYDVLVDLRPGSPTYLRWAGVEVTEENHRGVFIPAGFAHGFQTREDRTEVLYVMGEYFAPECADGLPFDDAALGIVWPEPVTVISNRDRTFATVKARGEALRGVFA
jgi:dTDP-4-dehydrorhamnose 3,5-epimerase